MRTHLVLGGCYPVPLSQGGMSIVYGEALPQQRGSSGGSGGGGTNGGGDGGFPAAPHQAPAIKRGRPPKQVSAPLLQTFTVLGSRGMAPFQAQPQHSGSMAVAINGAHGSACNMVSACHTAFGRTEVRLGVDGEQGRMGIAIGQELLYDYEATADSDDDEGGIVCRCAGLARCHYLYRGPHNSIHYVLQ